jgi:hypothetical protein
MADLHLAVSVYGTRIYIALVMESGTFLGPGAQQGPDSKVQ